MLFIQKFIVRKHECGLLFKDGDFIQFLDPGTYRYFSLRRRYKVERYDISTPVFDHPLADYLVVAQRPEVEMRFYVVQTHADEVAVIYRDGSPSTVLGPGERKLYWKGVVDLRVERHNLRDGPAIDPNLAKRLVNARDGRVLGIARDAVYACIVPDGHVGLLYVNGELTETLSAGLHAYWDVDDAIGIEIVDLRVRVLEVQGQEILTRDKVALRINVTATYQFVDAAKAVRAVENPLDRLYKEIQFGLRAAVGTRKLDALLEDKTALDRDIAAHLGERFAEIGIGVLSVGVKDIILPGDMKTLLGQVVEAEKAAEANVIRRREETNATRSLLNTAKVMECNGVALRLKELETLEKVTGNVGNLSVVGGLDALLDGLVKIRQ